MGLLTFIQIPCHHVLANEISLNLKYYIGLKHFFTINLGIGIIKKTTFCVRIFEISPCVLTQILSGRARWMWNLILHPMSTHTAYFWPTLLPQKQEIPEKTWWWLKISLCVFTQISSGRARWMWNLIPHPTSTHLAYFWRTPLPKKQEIPGKKCDDDIITFFRYFLFFG